jgi:hypothetical protein
MATYDKDGNWVGAPIEKTPKKKGGKGPRASGNRVERIVAKELGGTRTPMSGAVKQSNHNLTGDVEVNDNEGKPFLKLEVKYSGSITPKGEKSYTLTTGVLDQMEKEAHEAGELGALVLQFKGGKKYAIIGFTDFGELIELAKLGRTIQKGI